MYWEWSDACRNKTCNAIIWKYISFHTPTQRKIWWMQSQNIWLNCCIVNIHEKLFTKLFPQRTYSISHLFVILLNVSLDGNLHVFLSNRMSFNCYWFHTFRYISEYVCTNTEVSATELRDIRQSFPSGHSSFSMYIAAYFCVSCLLDHVEQTLPGLRSVPLGQLPLNPYLQLY